MAELEKELWSKLKYLSFVFALCSFMAILQKYLELSQMEFLGAFAAICMGVLMIVMWSGFRGIAAKVEGGFDELRTILSKGLNSRDPEQEEKKEEAKNFWCWSLRRHGHRRTIGVSVWTDGGLSLEGL